MAGEGVYVDAEGLYIHGDVARALGTIDQGQGAALAGQGTDLLERKLLARGPVDVGEGGETSFGRYRRREFLRCDGGI